MDVTIRGITFPDIDLTDADVVESYDKGMTAVQNLKRPAEGDIKGTANFIRSLCDVLRDWFDELFGEGAGDQILPRDSMKEGLSAFRELISAQKAANEETEAIWKEFEPASGGSAQPSRQQRRSQGRMERRAKQKKVRKAPVTDLYSPERLES